MPTCKMESKTTCCSAHSVKLWRTSITTAVGNSSLLKRSEFPSPAVCQRLSYRFFTLLSEGSSRSKGRLAADFFTRPPRGPERPTLSRESEMGNTHRGKLAFSSGHTVRICIFSKFARSRYAHRYTNRYLCQTLPFNQTLVPY